MSYYARRYGTTIGLPRTLGSHRRSIRFSVSLLIVFGCCLAPRASAQVTTWTGAVNDSWSTAGNWSNGVPNSASFSAVVGAPAPTDFNGPNTLGNLSVLAGGVLNVGSGSNFSFDAAGSIANAGQINISGNSDFQLLNMVTNTGTIIVAGSGTTADLELINATVVTGTGTIFLDGANARISDSLAAATLFTNGAGHTIRGNGQVGASVIDVVNNGVIRADVAGQTMTLDPQVAFTNNGLLTAGDGGVLRLGAGTYDSTGGLLEAIGAGSSIERTAPTTAVAITLGDVRATGGGVVNVADSTTVDFDLPINNHTLEFRGQSMTDIFGNPAGLSLLPSLASTPGNLGSGQFKQNNGRFIIGDGLNFTSLVAASDFNPGTIIAEEGSTFAIGSYSWEPAPCETGSPCPGTVINILGVHPVTSGGTLAGTGTIANGNALGMGITPEGGAGKVAVFDADLVNNGVIAPGNTPQSTGTLTLRGDEIILGDTSTIQIEVGRSGSDAVTFVTKMGEAVALNGALNVSLLPSARPATGDLFTILTAAQGLTGMFDTTTLPLFGGLLEWQVLYNPTSVVLQVTQGFIAGDFNRDGSVNAADYTVWRDGLGANFTAADFDAWQSNFGASSPLASLSTSNSVPEPTAIGGMLLFLMGLYRRRRKGTASCALRGSPCGSNNGARDHSA